MPSCSKRCSPETKARPKARPAARQAAKKSPSHTRNVLKSLEIPCQNPSETTKDQAYPGRLSAFRYGKRQTCPNRTKNKEHE
jgi:hypothetical protein